MQGFYAVLKSVHTSIANKGKNDVLMREMLIAIDSVTATVQVLHREDALTPIAQAPSRDILAITQDIQEAVKYYLYDCRQAAACPSMLVHCVGS